MNNSIKVVELAPFPANSNPFHHDAYHMGTNMGTNVTIMYPNHDNKPCDYFIICNTVTGERIKIVFDNNPDNKRDF